MKKQTRQDYGKTRLWNYEAKPDETVDKNYVT